MRQSIILSTRVMAHEPKFFIDAVHSFTFHKLGQLTIAFLQSAH
jgi:hypothetical protein